MTTTSIITIILSSSFLSAIMTGCITWLIKRYDFRQEYYKELTKKRIECYGNIEEFIGGFTLVGYIPEDGSKYYTCMADSNDYVDVFIKDLGIAIKHSMWINNVTRKILGEFNNLSLEYNQLIVGREISNEDDEIELMKLASRFYKQVQELLTRLKKSTINDLKNLHKLDFEKFDTK
jgi:hypothetical protein